MWCLPVISGMPEADCVLWPPNGKWVRVARVSADDALSGVAPDSLRLHIESNEPSDEPSGDAVIVNNDGAFEVWLRAARAGSGSGRLYSIAATVADLAGNVATATTACTVPHDWRR